jgi:hypothetical protein
MGVRRSVVVLLGAAALLLSALPLSVARADTAGPLEIPVPAVGLTTTRLVWDYPGYPPGPARPIEIVPKGLQLAEQLFWEARTFTLLECSCDESFDVQLTVPVGGRLVPGTYATNAASTDSDGASFTVNVGRGIEGYGTGSFTVVRSTLDPDTGQVESLLATYDETEVNGYPEDYGYAEEPVHIIGLVSWGDTGVVPQVAAVTAIADPVAVGRPVTIRGVTTTAAGFDGARSAGPLTVSRVVRGRTVALHGFASRADGTYVVTDRPLCGVPVTYLVSRADALGTPARVTVHPLCTTAGRIVTRRR